MEVDMSHAVAQTVVFAGFGWGFLWMMAILVVDFGPVTIALFFSGIGNLVLAVLVLVDLKNTWKPIVFIAGSLAIAAFLGLLGL